MNKFLLSAILTALAVVLGYAFLAVPNVEVFTATVFIAGYAVGPIYGLMTGVIAEFIYSLFNPLGAPMPFILLAQVVSMGFVGFVGGVFRVRAWGGESRVRKIIYFGASGFLLTLIFDVLTTLSFAIFMAGMNAKKILSSFAYGITFYIAHLVVNTLIFATIVPVILRRLTRMWIK